jgi:hypothetical protein
MLTAVQRYGAIRGIKDEVWAQLYKSRVGNGIRILQMDSIKHTLSELTIRGYRALISYN